MGSSMLLTICDKINSHMGHQNEMIVQEDLEGSGNIVNCIGLLKGRHIYPFVKINVE